MVSKKIFKSFSHYKSMETLDPQGRASLNHRGLIDRIYVGDHYTLLHTKNISCGPHGFSEKDFESFFYYKSMCCQINQTKNLMQPFSLPEDASHEMLSKLATDIKNKLV